MPELLLSAPIHVVNTPLSDSTKSFLCEHGLPKQIWGYNFSRLEHPLICAGHLLTNVFSEDTKYDHLYVLGESYRGGKMEGIKLREKGLVCVNDVTDEVFFITAYMRSVSFMNSSVQALYECLAIFERDHLDNSEEITSLRQAKRRYRLLMEQFAKVDRKCLDEGQIWEQDLQEVREFY